MESIVAQTYPKEWMEIIIVDDGSTDSTGAIADSLAAEHENVITIHQVNGGSSKARNAGLKIARGEYVGFVDSDDYIAPAMYEELVLAIERGGVMMAQTGRDEIAEDYSRLPDVVKIPDKAKLAGNEAFLRSLLLHRGDASFCTKLTKRTLFKQAGLFPGGELNEDFHLLIKMLRKVDKIAIVPYRRYHVYYRPGSNSRRAKHERDRFPQSYTDCVKNADLAMRIVKRDFPLLLQEAERFAIYQRLEYLLHIPVRLMTPENAFYNDVVHYLREHLAQGLRNPYLSAKDKRNLTLLTPSPRAVRMAHAKAKGL